MYLPYYVILCLRSSNASAADVGRSSIVIVLERLNGLRRLRDHDVQHAATHQSVLRRIFAGGPAAGAGHTDTETHNSWNCCDRSCRYNRRTVYGMRLRLRTIGLPAWRNRSTIINRLLQNEH